MFAMTKFSNMAVNQQYRRDIGKSHWFKKSPLSQESPLGRAISGRVRNTPSSGSNLLFLNNGISSYSNLQDTHYINGEERSPGFKFEPRLRGGFGGNVYRFLLAVKSAETAMDPNGMLPKPVPPFGGGMSYGGGVGNGYTARQSTAG